MPNKLDKTGGIIYNPNSTTDAPLHIRANNQACYLGFRNNTGEAVGFYGFSASNVPQVAINEVGIFDLIHSNNIGSQSVAVADTLQCHYDTSIAINTPDGTVRCSSNVPSSASGIFPCYNNANAILTVSKHGGDYDSQLGFSSDGNVYYRSFNGEAMNSTKAWKTIIDSGNIGSQHVASATNLISSSEYGVKTDQYGNLRQITHTSGACWQVVNSSGIAMLSVFFDGSEIRAGTNTILHAGNYETYISNYMKKSILDAVY